MASRAAGRTTEGPSVCNQQTVRLKVRRRRAADVVALALASKTRCSDLGRLNLWRWLACLQNVPSDAVILTELVQGGRQLHRVVCSGVCPDLLKDIEELRLRHDVQPESREVPAQGESTTCEDSSTCKYNLGSGRCRANAAVIYVWPVALALVVARDGQVGLRILDRRLFHESRQRQKLLWGAAMNGGHGHGHWLIMARAIAHA